MDPELEGFVKDFEQALRDMGAGAKSFSSQRLIRMKVDRFCLCPIIFVYFHRFSEPRLNSNAERCASELGISSVHAMQIIDAADYAPEVLSKEDRVLKEALLKAISDTAHLRTVAT